MEQPMEAAPLRGGEVITFYSYKGGTGRSMLLANVGWQLASAGKRVLLVDWDLEAPGLHRYFKPFLGEDVELREQPGVLEWVTDYWEARIDAPDAPLDELVASAADPRRYVRPLKTEGFLHEGTLDLMCAGRQDRYYAQSVADFDWTRLYEKLNGEQFIEVAKEMLVGPGGYDYVLIDSRTGVSDTSGFCTVALADTLVVCFTYNNQSVIGASNAARSILQQAQAMRQRPPLSSVTRLPRRRFRLFAVPSRVDNLDRERLERREQQAWAMFDDVLTDVAMDQRTAYWGAVAIHNHGQFAYEEVLAACMNRPTDTQSMLGSVANLTRELTEGSFTVPNPLSDGQRREMRELFSAQASAGLESGRDKSAYATVITRLPDATQRDALIESCFALLIQLYTIARPPERAQTESAELLLRATLPEQQMTSAERQMADTLTAAGVTERRITQDGLRALKIADDSVLVSWKTLRDRLYEQLAFLAARDQVNKARNSWEAAGSGIQALRHLAGECAGLEFTDEQGAWMGRPNLQFLAAMREVNAAQQREQSLQNAIDAARESERSARADWVAQREAMTQQTVRRTRNVGIVAVVMSLLAVALPMFTLSEANAVRRDIEASRDEALKATTEAQGAIGELQRRFATQSASVAYGLGYQQMTLVPAKNRSYDKAINHFTAAIQADPSFAEAFQGRAVARSLAPDGDKPSEILDWARFHELRPSLNRRSKFLVWALVTPGADVAVLRGQLAKLPEDARDVAARDLTPSVAADRISPLLDKMPAELRPEAEAAIRALRGGSEARPSVRAPGNSKQSDAKSAAKLAKLQEETLRDKALEEQARLAKGAEKAQQAQQAQDAQEAQQARQARQAQQASASGRPSKQPPPFVPVEPPTARAASITGGQLMRSSKEPVGSSASRQLVTPDDVASTRGIYIQNRPQIDADEKSRAAKK